MPCTCVHLIPCFPWKVTYEECKKSLELFQNSKSPGVDGLTVEFYKHFFDLIGLDLLASLNRAYELGSLSISQRQGYNYSFTQRRCRITALTKLVTHHSTQCRLQNSIKTVAMKIEPMLPELVHPDQTGFVKGRYIGENVRLIFDIM